MPMLTLREQLDIAMEKVVIYDGQKMTIKEAKAESERLGRSLLSFSLWLNANYPRWYEVGDTAIYRAKKEVLTNDL